MMHSVLVLTFLEVSHSVFPPQLQVPTRADGVLRPLTSDLREAAAGRRKRAPSASSFGGTDLFPYMRMDHVMFLGVIGVSYARTEAFNVLRAAVDVP